jgi:hypothetical protein
MDLKRRWRSRGRARAGITWKDTREGVMGMDRNQMIEVLMQNAAAVLDLTLDYDPTDQEVARLLGQERARLDKKTDLELRNMVIMNCG